jgi:hypothetical protein
MNNPTQSILGFALVSSSRNLILFYNSSYEITKRIQLHFMRNDLLYLIPVDVKMLHRDRLLNRSTKYKSSTEAPDFDKYNCHTYTVSGAGVLQVELDVAPHRMRRMSIQRRQIDSAPEEKNLHTNMLSMSKYIEGFKQVLDEKLKRVDKEFEYIVKGNKMFKEFCSEHFNNGQLDYMFDRDLSDEMLNREVTKKLNTNVTDAIMSMDFTLPPKKFQAEFNKKIHTIPVTVIEDQLLKAIQV